MTHRCQPFGTGATFGVWNKKLVPAALVRPVCVHIYIFTLTLRHISSINIMAIYRIVLHRGYVVSCEIIYYEIIWPNDSGLLLSSLRERCKKAGK